MGALDVLRDEVGVSVGCYEKQTSGLRAINPILQLPRLAWVETGCYVADVDGLPCASDFEDRYCGFWDSENDYSAHLAEEMCIWDEIPEHLHSYFDIDAW